MMLQFLKVDHEQPEVPVELLRFAFSVALVQPEVALLLSQVDLEA